MSSTKTVEDDQKRKVKNTNIKQITYPGKSEQWGQFAAFGADRKRWQHYQNKTTNHRKKKK